MHPTPEVLESSRSYQGIVVDIRQDRLRHADGHEHVVEVVEHRESMTVVAIDEDKRILLVRQYRHPSGRTLTETPAGCVDPGETPLESVNRELAEETGFQAQEVISLGGFFLAPGWTNEFMHVFLARHLSPGAAEPDADERIEPVLLPISEWEDMIQRGDILDSKSIAAWHLARPRLIPTQ